MSAGIAGFVDGVFKGMDWREARDARKRQREIAEETHGWNKQDHEWNLETRDYTREERKRKRSVEDQALADEARLRTAREATVDGMFGGGDGAAPAETPASPGEAPREGARNPREISVMDGRGDLSFGAPSVVGPGNVVMSTKTPAVMMPSVGVGASGNAGQVAQAADRGVSVAPAAQAAQPQYVAPERRPIAADMVAAAFDRNPREMSIRDVAQDVGPDIMGYGTGQIDPRLAREAGMFRGQAPAAAPVEDPGAAIRRRQMLERLQGAKAGTLTVPPERLAEQRAIDDQMAREMEADRFGGAVRGIIADTAGRAIDRTTGGVAAVGNAALGAANDVTGAAAAVLGLPEASARYERASDRLYNVARQNLEDGYLSTANANPADYEVEPEEFAARRAAERQAPDPNAAAPAATPSTQPAPEAQATPAAASPAAAPAPQTVRGQTPLSFGVVGKGAPVKTTPARLERAAETATKRFYATEVTQWERELMRQGKLSEAKGVREWFSNEKVRSGARDFFAFLEAYRVGDEAAAARHAVATYNNEDYYGDGYTVEPDSVTFSDGPAGERLVTWTVKNATTGETFTQTLDQMDLYQKFMERMNPAQALTDQYSAMIEARKSELELAKEAAKEAIKSGSMSLDDAMTTVKKWVETASESAGLNLDSLQSLSMPQILTLAQLIRANPNPSAAEVEAIISGPAQAGADPTGGYRR